MIRAVSTAAIFCLAAILVLSAYCIKKKGLSLSKFQKPAALVLFAVAFGRYIYDQAAIYYVRGLGNATSPFYASAESTGALQTAFAIILVWFTYTALITTVFNEFFCYKTLRSITGCFSLPVFVIAIAFFDTYSVAMLGKEGFELNTVRLWMTVVEFAIAIALPLIKILVEKEICIPKTKKQTASLLYALPFAIISTMPCYVPQAFLEKIDENIKLFDFTEDHRIAVYLAFVIPFIIYHALKNKPREVNRFLMIYLSVSLLWIYIGRWNLEDLKNPLSWPLHLCNTAMFLIPLCLIFKMDRLFNFCLFINVMGAFLAMMLPNKIDGLNAIGTERVSFWINHYAAFFMPVLLVALKIFKRPKFKEWIYATVSLSVYFLAMLIVNAWFSNFGECDYFFLNSDFIVSSLGLWAEKTMEYSVSFDINGLNFTFYPIYQSLFYVVYIAFTVAIWFIYELLFSSWDAAEDRRLRERDYKRMKKELNEYLGGKPKSEPLVGDGSPRLVLNNFSKRYGSNKHYSVKGVSLDVKGGEIFGFLGPNGAGKSTIIKSIVGIQTITSGEIQICGFDVEKQPEYAKLNMGFVPDHYALYENLTGREYINYIADLYSVTKEYRDEVIEKLVNRFQLTGSFDNQMKTYSHGMKQKITIMSALVHNPKVWILDEPLTGLDPTSIFEVKECMKEHAANGNVVFFSSHIIDLVEKLCDRIAIIKKGKLRATKTVKELTDAGIELEQFYLDIINSSDDEHEPYIEKTESAAEVTL
ncbi:MAG: ATP-binding cassette domain-containing protein [Ruminococcaceae bacterium]|nr:ATP-binding cassette domain-containing protein [Oscillospiraceae bacterium]